MRGLRRRPDLQRAQGVEDPGGFGLFGPRQQLRNEYPAARIAQEGLHAQAFRQRTKLDIAPVAVRAHGDALQQQGGMLDAWLDPTNPDTMATACDNCQTIIENAIAAE